MNCKWKTAFLVLLIATISIQGYSLYADAKVKEASGGQYFCYITFPLDYEPEKYWNLTEPDPYILEAIENPENWTDPFNYQDSTFWSTAIWDTVKIDPSDAYYTVLSVPFKYNGTYYNYGVAYPGRRIVVTLLDEEPEEYWNLTNPDKYTLEAIENPGEKIVVGIGVKLALKQTGAFKYNGKYYNYDGVSQHDIAEYPLPLPSLKPDHTAMALTVTWVAVGSVYIVTNRKTKAEP